MTNWRCSWSRALRRLCLQRVEPMPGPDYMKKLFQIFAAILLGGLLCLHAGPVSLEPDEVLQLRGLLATNAGAARQFSTLQQLAKAALSEAPSPVERILTEGQLDNSPQKIRTRAALPDLEKIEALAWTWAVTGDARYAGKGDEFILAWVKVNHPDGNAINETHFEPLIVGYDLLRSTFSTANQQQVDGWLRDKATVLWSSPRGLTDNWFSHRLKIAGLIGWTINDPALIAETADGFHRQMNNNFKPDGASTDFYKRDALHYHLYTVEPLLTLARTAARRGQNFFDYPATNGATLKSGVDFVVPFANGLKTHTEFVNSQVSFDHKRAQSGQAEYQPHLWNPRTATGMFSEAAWFRPEYGLLAARLAGHPGEVFFNWQSVINAVSRHEVQPLYSGRSVSNN